jgi:hypothetical protein
MIQPLARVRRIARARSLSTAAKLGTLKLLAAGLACVVGSGAVMAADDAFLPAPVRPVSTVPTTGPSAGDQNPYGVAFVPPGFPSGGPLNPGDILVSNFNAASNLQGTGTTIMDVAAVPPPPPGTPVSIFFQGTAPLGLTTALNILREGFVLVGNFPSSDGTCGNASSGSILVIDKTGALSSSISGSAIQGPWDSALIDQGTKAKFFVANGLSGTVVRLDLAVDPVKGVTVVGTTQIASGYTHACDAVTFVDAPTGLVYDPRIDVLYVASTADNAVYAVSDAGDRKHDGGIGKLIYTDAKHLHGPLGMVMAPNGHLLVTNNDVINSDATQPSEIVEFTVGGKFVKEISIDPSQGGSFGLAVQTTGETAKFAAVDDVTSLFLVWTLNLSE